MFLNKPGKNSCQVKPTFNSLANPEEPHSTTDGESLLENYKNPVHCMTNLAATFLGFACDMEVVGWFLDEQLQRMRIMIEESHEILGWYNIMDQEHMTMWGSFGQHWTWPRFRMGYLFDGTEDSSHRNLYLHQ